MTFKQWVRDVFGPESRAARASHHGKSRLPWGQKRSPSFKPILEVLEVRTLLSGTPGAQDALAATITTDRYDYAPGATAVISGSGFAAGETVTLQVLHIDGRPNTDASHTPWTVTADAAGKFQTTWAVDDVDAVGSRLDVHAIGVTSHNQADATFTDSTTPRPFWIFGHNPNTVDITEQYINLGVNALEPDIEFFSDHASDPVSKGFYIAHQTDTSFLGTLGLSNYSNPTLSVHDYMGALSTFLSTKFPQGNTQLSLVEFDVKTEAAEHQDALKYIVSTINSEMLPAHPELYFLINVGTIADANSLFTSTADDVLKDVPAASRSHFGFSIDGLDDPTAVKNTLQTQLGTDANIVYGDGTSGCCGLIGATPGYQAMLFGGPVLADFFTLGLLDPVFATLYPVIIAAGEVAGAFIHLGPNVPTALQQAVYDRTAFGDFNMIGYGFSITGIDSMKMIIDSGVDGMIPADDLDVTSPFSVHGFNASSTSAGNTLDTQDALNLVKGGYGGTYLATTADDPFSKPGATTHGSGATATATVDTSNDATKGQVTGVTITNGGTYSLAPTVTFSGGGGSGAAGTATIDAAGHVTGVTLTNHGSGYTSAPEVTLNSVVTVTGSRQGYALEVKTSDILGAGTDAALTFTLHGENGDASATVNTNFPHEMERDDTNHVFIPSTDLGKLNSITVTNSDGGFFTTSEWNVDWIQVRSLAYIGSTADDLYYADYGGQDVGNPVCFGILGCADKGDQNPSTRGLTLNIPYLTATSQATATGGVEGVTGATLADATFHDRNLTTAATDFTITAVDWGDGSTDATGLTVSGSNGDFTVNGSHLYTEEGNYGFSITVKAGGSGPDKDKTCTINGEVDISDPAVALNAATFQATEGTLSAVQTLATFTDPGGAEALADYTVDVDWGNGTFVSDANVSISGPVAGVFTVTGQHLYAEEDGYSGPVQVRITHEASGPSPVVTNVAVPLTLTDPPLIVAGTSWTVVRGASPDQAVATFTDPGGAEPNLFDPSPLSNHYTATIHWGDGSPDDAGVITYNGIPLDDSPTNTFTVSSHHDYTTNGTYTVTVTIHHEGAVPDAQATTNVTVVSLLNHAPGFGDTNSLVIGVALSGSTIRVVPVGKQTGALTDTVQVLINGKIQINTATGGTTFTGFNTITIYGQAGNDDLQAAGSIKKNAALFGRGGNDRLQGGAGNDTIFGDAGSDVINGGLGDDLILGGDGNDVIDGAVGDDHIYGQGGNDTIVGGLGNNILVGGDGNDKIVARSGRNIIIGGNGSDKLYGNAGDDILIAGSTAYDEDDAALQAILNEWASRDMYNDRVKFIRNGGGANGVFTLDDSTVFDDGAVDTLIGDGGRDWFWVGVGDKIKDHKANEQVN